MKNTFFKSIFILTCWLLIGGQNLHAQTNILENNKALIEKLAKFEDISEIDSNFIRYQTKETAVANYGFGVASKKNGEIIFPAQNDISYFIKAYGKYIAIAKRNSFNNNVFGLINDSGKTILDFKYDRIGSVFVPLPDSLITVQMGNKFGVFNTTTQILSPIIYNNTNNALNDGYAYHEGGSRQAKEIVYSQLGLKGFYLQPNQVDYIEPNAKIMVNDNVAYLVNKKGEKISKNYDYDMELFYKTHPYEYYIGAVKDTANIRQDARKLFLINGDGKEIAEISSQTNDGNRYFIELERHKSFYFIETNKTVTIPENYYEFVECYAKDGFIGFRNLDTNQKLFVDKYGNQIIIGLPPLPKPVIITQQLNQVEIDDFKKLATDKFYLGRVTKYQYNSDNKLYKEAGFDFDAPDKPRLGWEDTYYYDKTGKVERITRYDGRNEPYDLDTGENSGKTKKTFNAKKQLTSSVFTSDDYKYEEHFVYDSFGNLKETTKGVNDNLNTKSIYKYNTKKQVIREDVYRDNKPDYSYITTYDNQNRKTKYDMVNSKGLSTGIWFYKYNPKNQLNYQIDLYGLSDEKKQEAIESAPPPPPPPMKIN